ncbi:MAG: DsbA family protein, partial [Candidatus Aenigmarchaeota archaeon]|nr:DsbA family protein [Candidatus Aenigmarchaeota archaeon]
MIVSFAYSAFSVYNWAAYGNCNGEDSDAFCVFNAFGNKATITLSDIPLNEFPSFGPNDAKIQIVEFGCYQCPYTLLAESEMRKIRSTYPNDVHITFIPAPVPHHYNAVRAAEAAMCADKDDKYWEYHDVLFNNQPKFNNSLSSDKVLDVLEGFGRVVGLGNNFDTCLAKGHAADKIQKASEYSINIGIEGTPTFYINGVKTKKSIKLVDVEKLIDKN